MISKKNMLELKSKSVYRKNLGSMVLLSGILWGSKNTNFEQFLSIFTFFRPPLNPHSIPPLTPNFFCRHFLTSIQAYFTFKSFQDHLRLKNVNFHASLYFIKSENSMKSLHKIERSSAISIFKVEP